MTQALTQSIAVPLDTVRRVATPEGCELNLRIAGPTVRTRAWLFDFVIRLILLAVAAIILANFGRLGSGITLLLAFVLEWLYPVICEAFWGGATPGKKFSNLVVLHDDGTPVGWGASFARNTLRFVDFLPFGYACGLFTMWLNKDSKRLGDLLAGTVVVYRSENPPPAIEDDYIDAELPPFPLTLPEQRALLEYRQRASTLTEARAFELAELALPLTEGMRPDVGKTRLFRIANALLGRENGHNSGKRPQSQVHEDTVSQQERLLTGVSRR
jgi:uncharacterized RDD family membrane protein YckC